MLVLTRQARARARIIGAALAQLGRYARRAGDALARLALSGHAHSPRAAWLIGLLERIGAKLRRAAQWIASGV
jgi:hypothetical protein